MKIFMKNTGIKDLLHKYSIWGEHIWEVVKQREREGKLGGGCGGETGCQHGRRYQDPGSGKL